MTEAWWPWWLLSVEHEGDVDKHKTLWAPGSLRKLLLPPRVLWGLSPHYWEAALPGLGPTPALTLEVMAGAASIAAQSGSLPAVGMGRRAASDYRQEWGAGSSQQWPEVGFLPSQPDQGVGSGRPMTRTP